MALTQKIFATGASKKSLPIVEYTGTRLIRTSSGHTVHEPGVRIERALNKNVTLLSHFRGHIFFRYKDESRHFHEKNCLISELRQHQVHCEETRRSFIIYSFGQSDKLINLCP